MLMLPKSVISTMHSRRQRYLVDDVDELLARKQQRLCRERGAQGLHRNPLRVVELGDCEVLQACDRSRTLSWLDAFGLGWGLQELEAERICDGNLIMSNANLQPATPGVCDGRIVQLTVRKQIPWPKSTSFVAFSHA